MPLLAKGCFYHLKHKDDMRKTYQPLDKSVDEYGKIPIQHIQVKMRSACFRLKANLFIAPIFQ